MYMCVYVCVCVFVCVCVCVSVCVCMYEPPEPHTNDTQLAAVPRTNGTHPRTWHLLLPPLPHASAAATSRAAFTTAPPRIAARRLAPVADLQLLRRQPKRMHLVGFRV
jgi:hypothetical protein